jgi:hypothetical protein
MNSLYGNQTLERPETPIRSSKVDEPGVDVIENFPMGSSSLSVNKFTLNRGEYLNFLGYRTKTGSI